MPVDTDVADQALDDRQWREPVELPRIEKEDVVPAPAYADKTTRSEGELDKRMIARAIF